MSEEEKNIGVIVVRFMKHLHKRAKGEAADLRQCNDLSEVRRSPALYALIDRLESNEFDVYSKDHIALCAGVMGQFRTDEKENLRAGKKRVPDALSVGSASGDPVFKLGRFRELIQLETPSELYVPMKRVVRHVGEDVNPFRLAEDMLYFGESVRERWAERYYRAVLPNMEL